MTGGMAFEGLNQAGALKKDLCVILNDNAMSISKNVGAMATYQNRIITGQLYNRIKQDVESILRSIPQVGISIFKIASKMDEAVKSLCIPGIMFVELGFKYVGPIDGHGVLISDERWNPFCLKPRFGDMSLGWVTERSNCDKPTPCCRKLGF